MKRAHQIKIKLRHAIKIAHENDDVENVISCSLEEFDN